MKSHSLLRTAFTLMLATTGCLSAFAKDYPAPASLSLSDASNIPLLPGDRLLFQNGQTYHGTLTIRNSGTAAAPITYTMTGTAGDRPVLDAGGASFGIVNEDHSYINIDHLTVQNAAKSCIVSVQLKDNTGGTYNEYIAITNNLVQNCGDLQL